MPGLKELPMTTVCLLTIGDEVVNGFTINTNAAYLSQRLIQEGFYVTQHLSVIDEPQAILDSLKSLSAQCDILLVTGGLGPTEDDLTKPLISKFCNHSLEHQEKVYQELYTRYGDILTTIDNQSLQPKEAQLFTNEVGTAYGFGIAHKECFIVAMPGVPTEMQPMFENEVLAFLKDKYEPSSNVERWIYSLGPVKESEVNQHLVSLKAMYPFIQFGIYISLGTLAIHINTEKKEIESDPSLKNKIDGWIQDHFGRDLYANEAITIDVAVSALLKEKKLTLSCAESCTGGRLSSRLTAASGSSSFFLGSVTAYSNSVKNKILFVKQESLDMYGAVSEVVAIEMARGIKSLTKSSYAIAITGIAGPTGAELNKPIGLVHFAIALPDGTVQANHSRFFGDRATIIERASSYALTYLYQMLKS